MTSRALVKKMYVCANIMLSDLTDYEKLGEEELEMLGVMQADICNDLGELEDINPNKYNFR